jgi:hypothetical protein
VEIVSVKGANNPRISLSYNIMEEQKSIDKAGFITKASAKYCDQFLLRAKIQLVPYVGGSLDTLMSGLGARYQYQRLENFISELNKRLQKLEGASELTSIEPNEELFDFTMQVFDQVIRTRSEEKRKRFANLVANQTVKRCDWDEAETACRLLADLTDIHIQVLDIALKVEPCDKVFKGERVLTLYDRKQLSQRKEKGKVPTNLSEYLPSLTSAATEMICSELMSKGLLRDVGVGGFGGGTFMGYFSATEMAQWLMDWICEPAQIAKK